ncbi:MAG: hypothetical protein M4579_003751 [Chaenotheca gracillima]|nr:MAG: hypothetical protein M4579_003751 [Chaenotheca gracillima]
MTRATEPADGGASAAEEEVYHVPEVDTNMAHSATDVASEQKEGSGSDGERERPVREKLKKTSIATMPNQRAQIQAERATEKDAGPNSTEGATADSSMGEENSFGNENDTRGRPQRKRSFDDSELGETEESQDRGTRKRSRDLSPDGKDSIAHSSGQDQNAQAVLENTSEKDGVEVDAEAIHVDTTSPKDPSTPEATSPVEMADDDKRRSILSPKKKRSRDQFDQDEAHRIETETVAPPAEPKDHESTSATRTSRTAREEPEKKRHRDTSQEPTEGSKLEEKKIPAASGFANTSSVSPFKSLPEEKSTSESASDTSSQPQTSSSAFAKSGFGALAGSATSPFGSLSPKAEASPFGTFGGGAKPAGSVFGSSFQAPANSTFGGGSSGFGKFGGGFGGPLGGTRGTDFSSKGVSSGIGLGEKPAKQAKPFGAPAESREEDDSQGDDDGEDGETGLEGDPKAAAMFQAREVETGEEGEETLFANRAKLFYFNKEQKVWKERGNGTLKLNTSVYLAVNDGNDADDEKPGDGSTSDAGDEAANEEESDKAESSLKQSARLIMRAEGVLRVVLNVPIYKGMKFGDIEGNAPSSRTILTTAYENGVPMMFQIRFSANSSALELYQRVHEIQKVL